MLEDLLICTCSVLLSTVKTLEEEQTVWIELPENLEANVENQVFIQINNVNPITYLGGVFSLKTQKYYKLENNIIFDQNLNFGVVPYASFTASSTLTGIDVNSGVGWTYEINGINDISLYFTFQKQVGNAYSNWSQMKILLPYEWSFNSDSKITLSQNDSGNTVTMYSYEFISPNQLQIIFSTNLFVNTEISLTINNIQNPNSKQSIAQLKAYTFPYNQNKAVEKTPTTPLLKQVKTEQVNLSLEIKPGLYMPNEVDAVQIYKFAEQYIRISITTPQEIPPNYYLQFDFGEHASILRGSIYIENNLKNYDLTQDFQYEYGLTSKDATGENYKDLIESFNRYVKITNIGEIKQNTVLYLSMKIYVHNPDTFTIGVAFNQENSFSVGGTYVGSQILPVYQNLDSFWNSEDSIPTVYSDLFAYGVQFTDSTLGTYTKQREGIAKLEDTDTSQVTKYQNGIVVQFTPLKDMTKLVLYFTSKLDFHWYNNNANQIKPSSVQHIDAKFMVSDSGGVLNELTGSQVTKSTPTPANSLEQYTQITITFSFQSSDTYYILFNNLSLEEYQASNGIDRAFDIYAQLTALDTNIYYGFLPLVIGTKKSNDFIFSTLVNQAFDISVNKDDDERSGQPATIDIVCQFIAGKSQKNDDNYLYTDWDRVVIYLPDEAIITPFHIAIPDISVPDSSNLYAAYYQIGIGKYDTNTRIFNVFYTQIVDYDQLLVGVTPTEDDEDQRMTFDIIGYSGSERGGLEVKVYSTQNQIGNKDQQNGITNDQYGSAVVLVTDWQLWQNDLSNYEFINNEYITNSGVNAPLAFQYVSYKGTRHYITIFPLINEKHFIMGFTFYLENVLLPYSHMLPEMKIIVTNYNGQIDSMRTIVNSGDNNFFFGYLKNSNIVCNDFYIGVKNTNCVFEFQPNIRLQSFSQIYLGLNGLLLSEYSCSMKYYYNLQYYTINEIYCDLDDLNDILKIQVNITETMPLSVIYYLNIGGIEIQEQDEFSYELQLRDISGNLFCHNLYVDKFTIKYIAIIYELGDFVIEKFSKIFHPEDQEDKYILIESISFDHTNFDVITNMYVTFYIPRQPNLNEYVCLNLTESLQKYNQDISRLNIKLYRDWNLEELSIGTYFYNDLMMIELDDFTQFYEDFYQIHIYNIKTPEDDENYNQEYFQIYFIRQEDENIVIQNNKVNSQVFPELIEDYNDQITLQLTRFNYQGAYSEFKFDITTDIQLNYKKYLINILFPVYYSSNVANYADLQLICQVDGKQSDCTSLPNNPYMLQISNVSKTIYPGQTFQLSILDITTQHYINILGVKITNSFIRYSSTHTITFKSSQIISNAAYVVQILFPSEYNLLALKSSLTCRISQQTYLSGQFIDAFTIKESVTGVVQGSMVSVQFTTQILNDRFYQIAITGVPTPYECVPQQIVAPSNYLMGNDNEIISITQGTYSNTLYLTTSSGSNFATNVQAKGVQNGFQFSPSTFYGYLGKENAEFRLGVDRSTEVKKYTISLEKTEKSSSKTYNMISNLLINVVDTKIQIPMIKQIKVPYGGCSLPQKIELPNGPYDQLIISQIYDKKTYRSDLFRINQDFSDQYIYFNSNQLYHYYSFCVDESYKEEDLSSEIVINYELGGVNSDSYVLQYSQITCKVSKRQKYSTIQSSVNVIEKTKTWAQFDIYVTTDGTLFWEIFIVKDYYDEQQPLALDVIKQNLKDNNQKLDSFDSHIDYLQTEELDHRVNMAVYYSSNTNYLELSDLMPESIYKICHYFEDQFRQTTTQSGSCSYFSTQSKYIFQYSHSIINKKYYKEWQKWIKIEAVFKYDITLIELNNLLCWLSSEAETYFDHIIESFGYACSFEENPGLYYQQYKGDTFSNLDQENYFYLMPKKNFTGTDPAIDNLSDIFVTGTNLISNSALSRASSQYGIEFIKSMKLVKQFNYTEITNAQNGFDIPSLKNGYQIDYTYDQDTKKCKINISDVQLSGDGMIYFILDQLKEYEDLGDDDEKQGIQIIYYDSFTPSIEQVLNCQDFYNQTADACARAVLQKGSKTKVTFEDLDTNSQYNIYYITTNEYPLRPIATDSQKVQLLTGQTLITQIMIDENDFGQSTIDRYQKLQNIGDGSYGVVYRALDKLKKEEVALKKMKLIVEQEGVPATTIREISLLREIKHDNVVQLKDVVQEEKTLYLVFEQLDYDLNYYLKKLKDKQEYLNEQNIKKFLYKILCGIQACHSRRILHRDLKPQNILLSKDGKLKIGDFGLSRTYSIPIKPYTNEVVTLWYRAPELLLGSIEYSTPVDIWSVGCIFVELVTNDALFAGDTEIEQLNRIFKQLGTPNEETWPGVTKLKNFGVSFPTFPQKRIEESLTFLKKLSKEGIELLSSMLQIDPTKRITARAALNSPYFDDIKEQLQKNKQKSSNTQSVLGQIFQNSKFMEPNQQEKIQRYYNNKEQETKNFLEQQQQNEHFFPQQQMYNQQQFQQYQLQQQQYLYQQQSQMNSQHQQQQQQNQEYQ
ncbi:Protein kinase-like domain [Pseudocohnilembus persalinus]|uniref:Cyclin-dependent kinase 2 homolog n=1 Tax=Pseudocohnilembus persalinus TaxID=266149 RepID=A0A0V0R0J2_PSEPJ|nr:Protein kinase-like domain [Pseudocohnilembus persalinus]|eukprot:KRX08095.1 Protein kinase-like domain [Pseudocohnilembus persalinus]